MIRRLALALLAATLAPATALSQTSTTCDCSASLDSLVSRVRTNYPGWTLEVRGTAREQEHRAFLDDLRTHARDAGDHSACIRVLQEYVAWFRDGHLFVGGRPPIRTSADSARLREAAPHVDESEAQLLAYLEQQHDRLDPVEGIWMEAPSRKLGVRRAAPDSDEFVAFVLASADATWKPGDVRAELTKLPDGSYDVVMYDDARARTRPHVYKRNHVGGGVLQRGGLLLHMPPVTWGRLFPLRPGQEELIDPVDPREPTARVVGDDVVVLHIPSHVASHAARLNALVDQYRSALARADLMIIDLRGNEGGAGWVTNVLMPFLASTGQKPARYLTDGESAVLASPDNIRYFERMSWAPAGLVQRLRGATPGTLVPYADPQPTTEATTAQTPDVVEMRNPRRVAILTDASTVSAAEAFILRAMRSTKVTLFGQPTGGSIDYQTVGIVAFGCPDSGFYMGYPTIVGSDRLPQGGVRPTGIVPDVLLDPDDPDPIGRIIAAWRDGGR